MFAHSIRFLKEQALNIIRQETRDDGYKMEDIQWVLTVPAIWTPRAKQFMREAAYEVCNEMGLNHPCYQRVRHLARLFDCVAFAGILVCHHFKEKWVVVSLIFFIGWPWVIWESRAVDNCFRTWSCGTVLHRKTPGENGCCVAWRTTLSTQYTLYGCRHRGWGFLWAKIFVVYVSEEPFQI